ncbi:hypothetical protein [Lentibacillus salinarum]|uniref:Uncharacterized protein n=1 Tax=Lentibacillus salinarum TaxID=446820 RepID=A0ABW3ZVS9_9BACI
MELKMKDSGHAKINSIRPFLNFDSSQLKDSLNNHQTLYIVDNVMLTKMRKDIVRNPIMVKGFKHSNLIIIPDIILEEASENLPNEQVFRDYYYELFQILSKRKEIYVVSLEKLFDLLQHMLGKREALRLLKNITLEAVRTNQTITGLIKKVDVNSPTALKELEDVLVQNRENAGERFLTVFALVFLSMYFGPVYIFSDDNKGVYGPFRTFVNNERLMALIDVEGSVNLIEQYQFFPYERLIQSIFRQENLSKDELFDLIMACSRNESRHILYSLGGYSCYTPISNKKLAEWIYQEIIKIQF